MPPVTIDPGDGNPVPTVKPLYYLTGVTGITPHTTQTVSNRVFVQVDDFDSQADLAARFGGGDDGVIETSVDGGLITHDQAIALGLSLLGARASIEQAISFDSRDPKSHPGSVVAVDLPAPWNLTENFKVQRTGVRGFEKQVSADFHVAE